MIRGDSPLCDAAIGVAPNWVSPTVTNSSGFADGILIHNDTKPRAERALDVAGIKGTKHEISDAPVSELWT